MNNAFTGIMLGLAISLVGMVSQPSEVPQPTASTAYQRLKTCEDRILYRLNFYSDLYVKLRMPYVWGGFSPLTSFDCSGYVYWCCKMAGIPVKRNTSFKMWLDKGSWPGERVFVKINEQDQIQFPDVLFWTYGAKRPFGHTAIAVLNATDQKGRRTILFREASSSKKVVKETEMKQGDYRWIRLKGFIILNLTPGFECKGEA